MDDALYCVFGASGCGRGIMPLARAKLERCNVPLDRLVFVDDAAQPGQEPSHPVHAEGAGGVVAEQTVHGSSFPLRISP